MQLPIIHLKLRTDKVTDGKHPIIFQVYFQKKRKQIFTGFFIAPELWDSEKQEAKSKHPKADWLNRTLASKKESLADDYFKQSILTGAVNIDAQKKQTRLNFFEYANDYYDGMKHTATPNYISKCKLAIADFKRFAGDQTFQSITAQLLKDYETHLFTRGLKRNTINGKFKKIKQVFTHAKIKDYNPFDDFRAVTYKQTKRNFLTIEEIKKIEDAVLPPELESVRNYFLLSCYTGLRFSDVQNFNREKAIINSRGVDRIIIGTDKTGEIVSIKLKPNVREIIDKLKKPLPSNVHTNRILKVVAHLAGIHKPVSFHQSRHSFSINCASLGIPMEAVAKLLGHTNIRTTAIYYKIVDTKIDEYMDRWDN